MHIQRPGLHVRSITGRPNHTKTRIAKARTGRVSVGARVQIAPAQGTSLVCSIAVHIRIRDSRLGDLRARPGESYRLFKSGIGVLFVVGQNLKAGRLWHTHEAFTRVFIF